MRKLLLLSLFTIAAAFPLAAADTQHGRGQSYISFDDGGTTVRQGDDGQEAEARLNFPVYPGDEVITNRRGRSEIRLSDGNVIALDRSTDVVIKSAKDSYDGGDANVTVVEVKYGHVMVERDDDGNEAIRVDTDGASYAATEPAIYVIDTDRGRDRVAVFDGEVEVRTPSRTSRIHSGDSGHVDEQGLYDVVSDARGGSDDFERWFIRRAQLYRGSSSKYLDHSLAYSDRDLDANGSWVYASDYGSWCWRPRVEVGWRPYFYGSWHYGRGSLVWVSYEPWGWVPYHYGRWTYDAFYGWLWMPGYAYSPAWVYWMYGPSYVGWAPAGWFDCYRPYYGWAYRPYARVGWGWGGGFYGRVRLHDIDLRPWTFVQPGSMIASRVDRAALNVDVIRGRLAREGGYATVSSGVARFNRSELRDPAAAVGAIARRGLGSGTGKGSSGTVADMTSFFRRDPELSSAVRDRIVRSRGVDGGIQPGSTMGGPRGAPSGVPTPGTSGTLEGRVPRDGGGSRENGPTRSGGVTGRVPGTGTVGGDVRGIATPESGTTRHVEGQPERGSWRNRDAGSSGSTSSTPERGARSATPPPDRGTVRDAVPPPERRRENRNNNNNSNNNYDRGSWRNTQPSSQPRTIDTPRDSGSSAGRDVPRRIIDGIGGARIYSGDRPSRGGDSPRGSTPPPSRSSGGGGSSSGGSSHSSGGGSSHSSGSSSHSSGSSSHGDSGGHSRRGN